MDLTISSPKRAASDAGGWEAFFPYYAGFPEAFACSVLKGAALFPGAQVLDPWNGSGTTTFSASTLGIAATGFDLNPIMLIVARARLLASSEADAVLPLAHAVTRRLRGRHRELATEDPLLDWFTPKAAAILRNIERAIRCELVGMRTLTLKGPRLENIASIAAAFYVALFSVARRLAAPYQSSNPTWFRRPRGDDRIDAVRGAIVDAFIEKISRMACVLADRIENPKMDFARANLRVIDTVSAPVAPASIDFVLTSPPYCTRIDYSIATRIELAVLHEFVPVKVEDLGRQMIGSTRVPRIEITPSVGWGTTCLTFLEALKGHPSRASAGYYYKTHVDYFDKMSRALSQIARGLKPGGRAVLVVQDSYYKDIHNDLPAVLIQMCGASGLALGSRQDFSARSMAGINPYTRLYKRSSGATESVLCFERNG
jgi:SAM-dependent methyltransferase